MTVNTQNYWKKIVLFTSGRIVTTSGYGIFIVIVTWYVYSISHSVLYVMFLGLAEIIPTVLAGLFSGYVADNYDRLKVMLLTDFARFTIITAVLLDLYRYGFGIIPVLFMVASEGFLGALFRPASMGYIPEIAEQEDIQTVNGILTSGGSLSSTASFLVGGIIVVSVSSIIGLLFDSFSYLYGVATLFLIAYFMHYPAKGKRQRNEDKSLANPFSGVKEGFLQLMGNPGIFWLSISTVAFQFFYSMAGIYMVVYVNSFIGASGLVYGIILFITGASSALGGMLPSRIRFFNNSGILIILSTIMIGMAFFLLGRSQLLLMDYILFGIAGLSFGVSTTIFSSVLQTKIDESYLGRVFAVDELLTYLSIPAGQIVGGILITATGVSETYSLAGLGMLAIGAVMVFLPKLKSLKISGTPA